ncbi:hypothetical protein EYF80_056908 [Liparis tanakae]|uniref:Uncharacterized protein n=1 Tax=Liparis tanakae TaxID=230148 RepID=A0A4Z2EVT5_9TELE|nr:hypothetical protein EYF80_056908 [Liparis tanakae]
MGNRLYSMHLTVVPKKQQRVLYAEFEVGQAAGLQLVVQLQSNTRTRGHAALTHAESYATFASGEVEAPPPRPSRTCCSSCCCRAGSVMSARDLNLNLKSTSHHIPVVVWSAAQATTGLPLPLGWFWSQLAQVFLWRPNQLSAVSSEEIRLVSARVVPLARSVKWDRQYALASYHGPRPPHRPVVVEPDPRVVPEAPRRAQQLVVGALMLYGCEVFRSSTRRNSVVAPEDGAVSPEADGGLIIIYGTLHNNDV